MPRTREVAVSDTIRYQTVGQVAWVTLHRPEARNALNLEMKDALLSVLRATADDDSIRAVVLTGAGRAFCAGQDLAEHAEVLTDDPSRASATVAEHYNPIARAIATMPKPVVAAVNGAAAGAGASMAFAADFRLAADGASFVMAFSRVGLGPDTGASWTLQRLVGQGRALAMLMLAEPVLAQAAFEMGLVHSVLPPEALPDAAQELAARLAAGPTAAYAATKEAVAFAATSDLSAALTREAELQGRCMGSDDHRNATRAFVAKQQPVFTGR
jgi:2-(1,2-epoxy-1,2-dihydrophenyl)acetyl-CoA isomerase